VAAGQALARAQAAAGHGEPDFRVHEVRVALKRLRTYWRMARPHVAPAAWARERDRLRALAASLAPYRDADVAAVVVETYVGRTGDAAVRGLLRRWVESKTTLAGPAREQALRSAVRRMASVPAKLERAGGGAVTWEWLEPGLKRAYRRSKRAWKVCRANGSDVDFHAWRRRIKDLQYLVELLRFLAPHRLGQMLRHIRAIADALGEAHDLVELREALERAFAASGSRGWSVALSRKRRDLLMHLRQQMAHRYASAQREAVHVYASSVRSWLHMLHRGFQRWARTQGRRRHRARGPSTPPDMVHGTRGRGVKS
jgi:CHAD domain-containing protein